MTVRLQRFVVLLQGVNVGARNSLPMADLRALLERLGGQHVRTYVQSGNALVDTTRGEADLTELAPLERSFTPERWARVGREIFLWLPNGQGRSPLAAAIGKLGKDSMTVTSRNWNTVQRLLAMAEEQA